jgi:hypothetical protein
VSEHTKGPWMVGGPYPGVSVIVCVDGGSAGDSPEPAAYEAVAILDSRVEGQPNPEIVANARLIAAAPDFYREATRVVEWIERLAATAEERAKDTRFLSLSEANAFDAKNYRASIKGLRAAIAKAEGK